MDETTRYPTLEKPADLTKQSRLARKSLGHPFLTLPVRCVSLALLYYVLVVVSMKFRFSTSGLSLVWPSNALLVATLTLTPRRSWWLYLLAIVPAHIAALSSYHLGLSWLVYQMLFNAGQAIACAVILQKFRPAILYFETLREVLIFLAAAVVLPGLANLVAIYPVVRFSSDADLLAHNSSEGFLAVWTSCWANNSASLMVFVPVVLVSICRGHDWIRRLSRRRVGESLLLAVLFITLTFLVYGNVYRVGDALPTVYLIPIPFLIWAAIRFGPVGACVSITIFVCISCWCAYLGQGPFLRSISIDRVTILQMCWIMISAPLLCLAAVVWERRIALENLKSAHSELQQFTPRLISAQEDERRRISRELHDDISQRLALLRVELDLLEQKIPSESAARHEEIRSMMAQFDELVMDVHNLSHRLHSSKLQHLGLRPALKEVCQQLATQHHLVINVTIGQLPDCLPEQLSLCFYRVAQEAIMNAIKHSGASQVDVHLECSGETLRMSVRDYGVGFDPSSRGKGLGLVTMQERLKMVGGVLRLESLAGEGTILEAEANTGDAGLTAA